MQPGPELNSLEQGMAVQGVYLLARKALATTKNGQYFGKLRLGDAGGEMEARLWERAEEALGDLAEGSLVAVNGRVESYRGQNQLILEQISPAPPGIDLAKFLPRGPIPAETLWKDLHRLRRKVAQPHLKRLLEAFFGDADFTRAFERAPAAKAAHHAYIAGLLEHTVSVGQLAHMTAGHYGHLDPDIMIAGALLHDVGKVEELTLGPPLDYTDPGRLLGHLVLGVGMLEQRLKGLKDFPEPLAQHLRHIIVSHHGLEQFGSPSKPRTPEAMALHLLDDLDAKTAMVKQALGEMSDPARRWTDFHRLLERHLYAGGQEPGEAEPDPDPEADQAASPRRPAPPSLFDS